MRTNDLLDAIGEAKETYVLEAAEAWNAAETPRKRSIPPRKLLLIAAVLALLTCLLGCAIAMLRLQDQKIGEDVFTRYYDENWRHCWRQGSCRHPWREGQSQLFGHHGVVRIYKGLPLYSGI